MNRKELIKQKIANKTQLINVKRATLKHTDGYVFNPKVIKTNKAFKSELPEDTEEVIYRTIIANTYNFMDSHEDVHLNGCFSKSVQENKRQLYIKDHANYTTEMAGKVLKAYEQEGIFRDFGYDSDKSTQALLKDVAIYKEQSEQFFSQMKEGMITQHSVGMMYVKISLAVDDASDVEGYKLYSSILPLLGNYKEAEEQGYFFAVQEAKEFETSAVTRGSNELTGVLNDNKADYDIDKIIKNFGSIEKFEEIYQNYVKTRREEAEPITSQSNKSFISMINIY